MVNKTTKIQQQTLQKLMSKKYTNNNDVYFKGINVNKIHKQQ